MLQWAKMEVITNMECSKYFNENVIIDSTLCATTKSRTELSSGDSGGPLVLESINILVGVISYSEPRIVAGFARVTSFLEWINHIKENN